MEEPLLEASAREVLDALSTPVALVDADHTILYLNDAWRSSFHHGVAAASEDFQPGRRYAECRSEAVGPGVEDDEAIAAALRGERHERISRHTTPDEVWWIRTRVQPCGAGPRRRVVVEKKDISERMEPEAAALRSQAMLQAVGFAVSRFLRGARWEEGVSEVLRRIGDALDVSRVYVFEAWQGKDGATWTTQRYEWAAAGVSAELDNPEMEAVSFAQMGTPAWPELLRNGQIIQAHTRALPEGMRELLESQQVRGIALSPIFAGEAWWGFLGVDECRTERVWTPSELEALRVAATLLGAAMQGKQAREALQRSVAQEEIIQAQEAALRELSAPLLPVHEQVLVLPLVGSVDAARVDRVLETLLAGIVERRARVAILDVTGVRQMDAGVASALARVARAVELLGAEVVITGISPVVAQTLVEIGADLEAIDTCANLQAGMTRAMQIIRGLTQGAARAPAQGPARGLIRR